jgi:hypothetical protein
MLDFTYLYWLLTEIEKIGTGLTPLITDSSINADTGTLR